jgi:transcription-repair coupling factor (superfamily II helicase)
MKTASDNHIGPNGDTIDALLGWAVEGKKKARVYGLTGSSKAYVLSRIREQTPNSLVVIVSTHREAEILWEDFLTFSDEGSDSVSVYPAWETLPWDVIPPTPDTVAQRLRILFHLATDHQDVFFASPRAILQRVIRKERLKNLTLRLEINQNIDRDHVITALSQAGYTRVDTVEEMGEFAVRGGIMDIFSPLYKDPLRLEWFGDQIMSLRHFDAETQRSSGEQKEALAIPAQEFLPTETDSGLGDFSGYLSERHTIILASPDLIQQEMTNCHHDVIERFKQMRKRSTNPLSPQDVCSNPHEMSRHLTERARICFGEIEIGEGCPQSAPVFRFRVQENTHLRREILRGNKHENLLQPLVKEIEKRREAGARIFFVSRTPEQANRLGEVLEEYGLRAQTRSGSFPHLYRSENSHPVILVGNLSQGFLFAQERLSLITDEEIFGERQRVRKTRRKKNGPFITNFEDLNPGNPVVHVDYGIGIYRGLYRLDVRGLSNDYLLLEYSGGDKLYVPVHRLNLVQRYVGTGEKKPRVDRLGGTGWKRVKRRVTAAVEKMARELLEIYAARRLFKGFSFSKPDRYFKEFEARFEYEETPDQSETIEDVLTDLARPVPMDRLICGDVGYGKTEVAIRAAFKSVLDAKQVAVLVPTTILAQQHYVTFSKRLRDYPVIIESLSRFKTKKQQTKILADTAQGRIDIIIGTHRLLQGDLKFKDLGLLIIDEEHRFGVTHKEKVKQFRRLVDVLSLSATPIPRTLHMSLTGIRDMSVITTPPQDRQSIRTFLYPFDGEVIRSAILQEIKRGGQVFFVHNRVQTIEAIAEYLRKHVPEARLAIAHGQMAERDLEKVMERFIDRQIDVLVCTSIIESGLDIPSANTIIINQAEQFGLADLYQLRGRVGRSHERAYAYLLVPGESNLSRDALKRLRAIQEFTELGSGFKLAIQDLEIRGAGNLLGHQQSGHIGAVGFEMYTQLVDQAMKRLRGEKIEEEITPEIRWNRPAFIPDNYVENAHQRLSLYKRLSSIQSDHELEDMRSEIQDRYGPLPEPVSHLLEVMRVKPMLSRMRVKTLDFDGKHAFLTFDKSTKIEPKRLVDLIQHASDRIHFTPGFRLKIHLQPGETIDRVIRRLFERLTDGTSKPERPKAQAVSMV